LDQQSSQQLLEAKAKQNLIETLLLTIESISNLEAIFNTYLSNSMFPESELLKPVPDGHQASMVHIPPGHQLTVSPTVEVPLQSSSHNESISPNNLLAGKSRLKPAEARKLLKKQNERRDNITADIDHSLLHLMSAHMKNRRNAIAPTTEKEEAESEDENGFLGEVA